MRKFTLYQASRFTKISRYKLEQAIQDGKLTCTEGKGNVKCFINEDDLNEFLENHAEEYRRFKYPEEGNPPLVSDEFNQVIPKEHHDQLINEKNRVISLLEYQNQQLMPASDHLTEKQIIKFNELKSIAEIAISELSKDKLTLINELNSQLEKFNLLLHFDHSN
jgi:hypothetical protein